MKNKKTKKALTKKQREAQNLKFFYTKDPYKDQKYLNYV